jgi:hypothetical protein
MRLLQPILDVKFTVILLFFCTIACFSLASPPINFTHEIIKTDSGVFHVSNVDNKLGICQECEKGKIKVCALLAFYHPGFEEIPPTASYIIKESNHPNFPVHGNIGKETFEKYGIPIPYTPTYEEWIKLGKPIQR